MSQEVARLEELLARVQRNAALPRTSTPAAFTAPPAVPAVAPSIPFESEPPPPAAVYEPEPPPLDVIFDSEPSPPMYQAPAALDHSVDDMLLADPFPSSPAPAAPPQSLTEMLDEDPIPLVSVASQRPAPGEDSGVMTRSELGEEPPEELLEDDIVEMSSESEAVVPSSNSGLDDLNFDDDELRGDAHRADDEPPASSSRHRVAGTMDEALARAAEHIELEEGREVPLKTPPPESGPQAAMALPAGIHAPLAPDIEELLEADILPVHGMRADLPTPEQLGQTIDLEEARGPHLELDSALAAAPVPLHEELPSEELEVTLPQREFGGGYQDDLMPPPEARQELEAHRQRFGEQAPGYDAPPESLAQYPSQQPAASSQGFAPVVVPQSVTTDSYSDSVSTVTVDANAELVPELLLRPDLNPSPVAKFIRVDAPRPRTFLELLDASLALGRD
jgi:hypothetical protein